MEITKSLQDDIVKIQHELITAIQNHQVGNLLFSLKLVNYLMIILIFKMNFH